MKSASSSWLPSLAIILLLLAIWEGYVRIFDVQKWLLPAPTVIAVTMVDDAALLSRHTWVTLTEVLIGFGLALASGVALASMIVFSRTLERAIYPFV
ncbi:MAG: ABC transporter permease, partial [Chloroflexi bacterium]|nr:ABC transporter permease [Chloroflexota bacterium]